MSSIAENVKSIKQRVAEAAVRSGRAPEDVRLCAATKMNDASRVREAIAAGVDICGENRVQELSEKFEQGAYEGCPLHFIGHLQKNKVKYLVGRVQLIESVDCLELLETIDKRAKSMGLVQDVLLEVNIGGEAQKGGIAPDELKDLISVISELPGIRVKGLMCVPPAVGEEEARMYFASMRRLFEDIASAGIPGVDMRELSMGMSGDYKSAIKEGATMVRVGTAIFGARPAAAARA